MRGAARPWTGSGGRVSERLDGCETWALGFGPTVEGP